MELVASRAMTRFVCRAGECDDTCCRGLQVWVDRKHHDLLSARMSSAEERAQLAAAMRPTGAPEPQRHALMVVDGDGTCAMLAGDGLCSIQARHGPDLLPDGCATFPRVIGRLGRRAELIGTTSCPELARQVLLHEDGLELVPAEGHLFGRGLVTRKLEDDAADPYDRSFLPVRGLVTGLLTARAYPIAARLFFVACFADQTRDQLQRGAPGFDEAALQRVGQDLLRAGALDQLYQRYQAITVDGPLAVSVVAALLQVPARKVPRRMKQIVAELEPWYAERGASLAGDPEALHRVYAALPPPRDELAARLELILERFAVQHLFRAWYVAQPSFLAYVHDLLGRVAVVRFLVRSQLARDPAMGAEAFDAVAVAAVQALSRMLEHDGELAARFVQGFVGQGLTLSQAVLLTRS